MQGFGLPVGTMPRVSTSAHYPVKKLSDTGHCLLRLRQRSALLLDCWTLHPPWRFSPHFEEAAHLLTRHGLLLLFVGSLGRFRVLVKGHNTGYTPLEIAAGQGISFRARTFSRSLPRLMRTPSANLAARVSSVQPSRKAMPAALQASNTRCRAATSSGRPKS